MDLKGLNVELTLDDFIPPHLQRRPSIGPSQSPTEQKRNSAGSDLHSRSPTLPPTEQTWDSQGRRVERHWIRYDGIGPTDEDGMPFASRSSVDKPRDWYKNMFKVLHRVTDSDDSDKDSDDPPQEHNQVSPLQRKPGLNEDLQRNTYDLGGSSDLAPRRSWQTLSPTPKKTLISPRSSYSTSHTNQSTSSGYQHKSYNHSPIRTPIISSSSPAIKQSIQGTSYHDSRGTLSTTSGEPLPSQSNSPSKPQQLIGHVLDLPYAFLAMPSKEQHHPQSPLLDCNPEETHSSLSSSSKKTLEAQTSTTDALLQLETELLQFTEELERDLEAHTQESVYILKKTEEPVTYKSPSKSEGGINDTVSYRTQHSTVPKEKTPVLTALVKFDFEAQTPKELSLQRGRSVCILKRVDKNWLLGELDGQRGFFPESYVQVLSPGQSVKSDTPQFSAVALYDFKADSAAELSLCKGQRVSVTRRVGANWFEGRVEGSGRLGLFPVNYVQVTGEPLRATEEDPKIRRGSHTSPTGKTSLGVTLTEKEPDIKTYAPTRIEGLPGTLYRALYDFSPNNPDELHLIAGDIVTVTQRCDDGWYVGACWRTESFGTFPGNFVAPYDISKNSKRIPSNEL
ncbi:vinexin isoform 2-T3 [Discoglossus pictus]